MKCTARFYKMNYDFSPEFAEAHHDGNESENNRFYDWEDELKITTEVKDIEVVDNAIYTLQGEKGGEAFSEEIKNVLLFNIIGEDGAVTQMACSKSLVLKYDINREEDSINLKVFLEEMEPLTNPIAGIYIAIQDFPKSLVD
ncbi:hypothetical protein ERX46_15195 [Brumimicrobium glaciale]|uniref:Uncharacterized protein n=1 Tax=Brumimicrobium glaciale TaxID=200475 RepID=A0A4Q4KFY7_9FLAO|nr:hypothetical protein [Brumimicrobium glaciale]RYM32031.1 hypothetical protein ERX46_15195 [Brumimicrobium glaciale]